MNSDNSGKKFGYEKTESVRNCTVKLPYVPGKSWEDSESVKSNITGSDISLTAEPEIKLSAESEIRLTAEPEIKSTAEPEISLTAEPEIKSTADPIISPKTDLAKKPSIELILDSDDEASSLSQKKSVGDDVENPSPVKSESSKDDAKKRPIVLVNKSDQQSNGAKRRFFDFKIPKRKKVKPPRPAFQYSKAIESKKPKEKVKLNLTAALACKTFTPYEYSKKVKALEALTGQRDFSVNPYCTVTVKGIKPQPYRVVKGFLIDSRIWIEKVANIQFVGDRTVFLVEKCYRRTFIHIIGNNPLITVLDD
ncbi:hypothetical protein AYI69_g9705 [Smittium culicis]|uniref:Uncharacterized protein n=1 Tax=Smittium culicis TaxID=133412 RepID=A0A1R1XAZ3_9FUNG|nr:hypothetical protein AYI69_g9705 [Smittium culicis]